MCAAQRLGSGVGLGVCSARVREEGPGRRGLVHHWGRALGAYLENCLATSIKNLKEAYGFPPRGVTESLSFFLRKYIFKGICVKEIDLSRRVFIKASLLLDNCWKLLKCPAEA